MNYKWIAFLKDISAGWGQMLYPKDKEIRQQTINNKAFIVGDVYN